MMRPFTLTDRVRITKAFAPDVINYVGYQGTIIEIDYNDSPLYAASGELICPALQIGVKLDNVEYPVWFNDSEVELL